MSGSSTARQKMLQFVNWKMRVTISDTREITGTFMAFDKHMNMILGDSEEYRLVKQQGKRGKDAYVEEKRLLGLLLLRGEAVISIKPVGPPAPAPKYKAPAGGAPAQAALPGTAGMAGMAGMIARRQLQGQRCPDLVCQCQANRCHFQANQEQDQACP